LIAPHRTCVMPKHSESLIHLIQTERLFSLLKVTNKPKTQAGLERKFFLAQTCDLSSGFNKEGKGISSLHRNIMNPFEYIVKKYAITIPEKV